MTTAAMTLTLRPPPSLLPLCVSQFEKAAPKEGPPDSALRLNWIYGYESEKTRNTVQYTASGDVVYTCGHYVILYDMKDHKQRFFTGHTETVLCLTMHPKRKIVATGEAGMHPRVIVWETDSREILFSDRDFHREGIIHVSFSGDGRLLGTIGNDVYHSLALFDWDKNELLFTTFVDKGICLSITFSHDDVVVVGGDSYINFYTKAPEGYVCRRGNFSRHSSLQPITTLEPLHGTTECLVAGTITGQLFLWTDRNCLRVIKGHDGSVNCMSSSEHGIVTGGEDKRIRMWTNTLDPGATFDVTYFGLRAFLRSVSMSIDGNTLVFGTLGASIFEISTVDGSDLRGGPIVTGHYTGDMQGVATNPCKHEFATVGDDRHLRIWDMKTKSLLKIATFDAYATCATYGPLGDVICVGLGGDATVVGKSGAYVVINEEDLTVVHEARDSSVPISLVAFSPEGETLAVGTADGSIYLYAVLDEYELIGRCVRHKAPVRAVDFSVDGEWLRSNSDGNDLCFFNSDDASYQSNLASMRDVRWASVTCKFSWHTRNVHRTAYDGETVMKLHAPAPSSKFVGTATNYGYLNLFPYPSQHKNARPRRTLAHYGDVAGFMFSYDGKRLLTAGRKDRCVIQWDVTSFKKDEVMEPLGGYASDDHDLECRTGEEVATDFMVEARAEPPGVLNNAPSAGYKKNEMRDLELNIWKEQITEPLHPPTLNKNVPAVSLRLEHVFGYKGHGMRSNVRYAEDGKVVYVVGGMGIALDRDTKKQAFYRVHDDAITSFASDKTGTVVATGQLGMAAKITVWRTKTMKAVWTSPDLQEASVSCLALGERGLLAAAGIDVNHCISIYDWKRNILLARTYAGPCHVNALAFSPDCSELLAVGVKDIKIWDVTERTMCPRRPVLGQNGRVQAHLCCVYFTGMPCVGTSDGNLYFIKDNELNKALQAHDGPVNAMHVSKSGTQMVTGGRDGAVRIWNNKHDCTKELFLQKIAPRAESFKIKGIAFHNDEGTVVVGTRGSEILEIEIKSGSLFGNSFLVAGHGCREVHGLATHPKKDVFVSCGDDNTMRVWSGKDNAQTRVVRLDCAARCAAFSPDGRVCAIGLGGGAASGGDGSNASSKVGSFMVFESGVFKKEYEAKDSNEPIRAIRFSPDSRILAVGSEDSRIILYNVRDNYTRRAQILTHRAPVMNIDFSVDGMFIISQDSTKRTCLTETTAGISVPSPASLRDEKWASWSSSVGWPVQGLWQCQPELVEPCSVSRSWNSQLLASGNTAGRVYVTHYPCQDRAGFADSLAHAGPVPRVAWGAGDAYVVSVGQKDHAVMKWRAVYDDARDSGDEGGLSCEDSEVERDGGHEFADGEIVRHTPLRQGAVEQWMSNIAPPSASKMDDDDSLPAVVAELEFAHGPRLSDVRQSLCYNEDGSLIFLAATTGVIYNRDQQAQRSYKGHTAAVVSVACDSAGKVVATGDLREYPELHLWDARTAAEIKVFKRLHYRGITSLSFSESGNYLSTLGQDASHSVVVLHSPSGRWTDAYALASCSVSLQKALWTTFIQSNEYPIVVGGDKYLSFFKLQGKGLERTKGVFGKRTKVQPILCGATGPASQGGTGELPLYTGTVSGHVYVWMKQRVNTVVTAHEAAVYAIERVADRYGFVTGGRDGLIKLWSEDFKLMHTYNVKGFTPEPFYLAVHTVRVNHIGSKLVVAMRSGEIYEVGLATHSKMLLSESHSHRELHGLALSPIDADEYVTVGDDGFVRVWSISTLAVKRRVSVDAAGRAVAWSPDGLQLCVGIGGDPAAAARDGSFIILNAKTLETVFEDRKAKKWISDVKYSPEKNFIALASMDGRVYIHDARKYNLVKNIETPNGEPILRVDWSHDAMHIRVGTIARELYVYTTDDLIPSATPALVRDLQWSSNHCPFAWLTKGVWRPPADECGVTSVDVHEKNGLVAVAYQDGQVRLQRYPCQTPGFAYSAVPGVSSQGGRMLFTANGEHLIVLDSYSRTILQYRIVPRHKKN